MFSMKKSASLLLIASALMYAPQASIFAAQDDHLNSQAAIYYCPMHPQVVSDKPGDCPICHMRLVLNASISKDGVQPVEGRVPVAITDTARKQLDIQSSIVEKKQLHKTINAYGRIAHDPELYQLQIDFLREESLNYQRDRNRTLLAQQRSLTGREKIGVKFLDMGLSEEWIEALITEGVPDKKLLYHHEAGGVWVYLLIRENDAALVKIGDPVTIVMPGLQNAKLDGKITFVDTKIDMETGAVRSWVLIENPPLGTKPNMTVSGSVAVDLGDMLALPEDAPLFTGKRTLVWVDEAGVFKPREVSLGIKAGGYYEIKEGLMPGEKVASNGNFFIDSESRLRASLDNAAHGSHS